MSAVVAATIAQAIISAIAADPTIAKDIAKLTAFIQTNFSDKLVLEVEQEVEGCWAKLCKVFHV
jgi:hypothetical protein